MSDYLIIGAGAVGTAVAERLTESDHRVTIVTRSGSGPNHPRITRVAADATRSDRIAQLAQGSAAIFNCANPPYNRWSTDWPPIANSLLGAAERTGAVLVTTGNLYVYGHVTGPMSPETPEVADFEKAEVRRKMWHDALDALPAGTPVPAELADVRWLLEELRVSLFAQQLGTAQKVSEKRILQLLADSA